MPASLNHRLLPLHFSRSCCDTALRLGCVTRGPSTSSLKCTPSPIHPMPSGTHLFRPMAFWRRTNTPLPARRLCGGVLHPHRYSPNSLSSKLHSHYYSLFSRLFCAMWPGSFALSCFCLRGVASLLVEGNCLQHDNKIAPFFPSFSADAAISCRGEPLQQYNSNRYWGTQFAKNASVVVYPVTTMDLANAVRWAEASQFRHGFAFVGGAHGKLNASSAYGLILDLSWMNQTRILRDFEAEGSVDEASVVIEYQGGATWGQVQKATDASGYTAVGARVANVGVGGFSTGGGIGFLAGAYGFARKLLCVI